MKDGEELRSSRRTLVLNLLWSLLLGKAALFSSAFPASGPCPHWLGECIPRVPSCPVSPAHGAAMSMAVPGLWAPVSCQHPGSCTFKGEREGPNEICLLESCPPARNERQREKVIKVRASLGGKKEKIIILPTRQVPLWL